MQKIKWIFSMLFFLSGTSYHVLAQNDLVVFSNNGEKFYLYVNGVQQNATYETNVRVTNIKQPWVKVKVVFEDNKKIPDLTTNVQFMWEAEEKKGWEFVYQIINKSGKYKIKPYSAAEINREQSNGQTVVNYSSEEPQPHVNVSAPANTNVSLNTQTVTSTTVVNTGGGQNPNANPSNGTGGINVNVSPSGIGVQIQDGTQGNINTNTGYTTTVVSTTVVSSSSSTGTPALNSATTQPNVTYTKCSVNDVEFEKIKKSITSKSFEDSKLTMAKQISDSKCLKSAQVRDIMKLFSFEQTRLDFAKHAYRNVLDKDNYYLVNESFQFENSIEELNEHIQK